ncbi:hypothetical protein BMETH_29226102697615, partial [methanotrophic bacterial endosymbiont of Bathymodiolus sp.]
WNILGGQAEMPLPVILTLNKSISYRINT